MGPKRARDRLPRFHQPGAPAAGTPTVPPDTAPWEMVVAHPPSVARSSLRASRRLGGPFGGRFGTPGKASRTSRVVVRDRGSRLRKLAINQVFRRGGPRRGPCRSVGPIAEVERVAGGTETAGLSDFFRVEARLTAPSHPVSRRGSGVSVPHSQVGGCSAGPVSPQKTSTP